VHGVNFLTEYLIFLISRNWFSKFADNGATVLERSSHPRESLTTMANYRLFQKAEAVLESFHLFTTTIRYCNNSLVEQFATTTVRYYNNSPQTIRYGTIRYFDNSSCYVASCYLANCDVASCDVASCGVASCDVLRVVNSSLSLQLGAKDKNLNR
jgi:hypothetical protein